MRSVARRIALALFAVAASAAVVAPLTYYDI